MRRFAVPLVITGSLAVLAALFFLLRAITAESPAATATIRPTSPPPSETVKVTPPTTPSAPAERAPATTVAQARPRTDRPPSLSGGTASDTPPSSDDAPPGTRLNTKNLHLGLPHMRERIAANTARLAACMGGKRPTAEITMEIIVAQQGDKVVVEQVDIDGDKTTLTDDALLDCMTKATQTLVLDGLPREAAAVTITRTTSVQDGAITNDSALKFSYIR